MKRNIVVAVFGCAAVVVFATYAMAGDKASKKDNQSAAVGVVDEEAAAAGTAKPVSYDSRINQLEEKIDDLKEKIFRTKTRLMLLEETMLGGVIGGSKLVLTHRNEIENWYTLESVTYYLDGNLIMRKTKASGSLSGKKEIEVYNNPITAGTHMVSVYMVYVGSSNVFSYIEGMKIKLKSSYTFITKEGKATTLVVSGYDRGGAFIQFKDRPAVSYKIDYSDLSDQEVETIESQQETQDAKSAQ